MTKEEQQLLASVAAQDHPNGSAVCSDANTHEGYPPQRKGAGFPLNTGRPEAAFYTPWTSPASGTFLHREGRSCPKLFEKLNIRGVTLKNRMVVSPMCMYSCKTGTGMPTDFHLVHQGQFAIRGASVVFTEAAAVLPNGRISPEDAGIWSHEHIAGWKRVTDFHRSQGALSAIQLAHAGRKASTFAPWLRDELVAKPSVDTNGKDVVPEDEKAGGWPNNCWAPSTIPHSDPLPKPIEMTEDQIRDAVEAFVAAAKRSVQAGYDIIEIHGAHGYLIHEFVSPLSNERQDKYGGSFENRIRFPLEIVRGIRAVIPNEMPLFYRISATDWHEGGEFDDQGKAISWGSKQSVELAKLLKAEGVDLIDVSSGGNDKNQKIEISPGYQVPFAEDMKKSKSLDPMLVSSVGLITSPQQAEDILQSGKADVIMLAREFLRNADFVTQAAYDLNAVINVPVQYQRAHTRMYK